jgi:glycosyltransferase involved in cell wall biosynthesis
VTRAPLFSVVIPTHNRVIKLQRALRSVAAQSLEDYEVIVVDDGSSDDTPAYLESIRSERCITLRSSPNRGVSASRNRGVSSAHGEFVVFLDDDDELRPGALAALKSLCLRSPAPDFLWGARQIHEMDGAGKVVGTREDDWSELPQPLSGSTFLPLALQIATNSAFSIRRAVFDEIGGFDEQLMVSEDRDLFVRLAEHGNLARVVAQIIIDVDEHFSNSLSRNMGFRAGPSIDLRVIDKHRAYLQRPEHRAFLNNYLLVVYAGFLQAGDRGSAAGIFSELRKRRALNLPLLRVYVRHAPEFRALKVLLRYTAIRRLTTRTVSLPGRAGLRIRPAQGEAPQRIRK